MMGEDLTAIVVDDEQIIALALTIALQDLGIRVCGVAATAAKAVELAQTHRPRIVLMDVRLKGERDGIDAAIDIHGTVGSSVIFITGSREATTVERIHMDHPADILFKPILPNDLRNAIKKVMGHLTP